MNIYIDYRPITAFTVSVAVVNREGLQSDPTTMTVFSLQSMWLSLYITMASLYRQNMRNYDLVLLYVHNS